MPVEPSRPQKPNGNGIAPLKAMAMMLCMYMSLAKRPYKPLAFSFVWNLKTALSIDLGDNELVRLGTLGAQCEIPPHIAQYPFEIASHRGYRTHVALFSCGIAQVLLRYPFCGGWGYRASTLHALQGRKAQKGGGYRTQLVMLRHQKPHSAQQGVSLT